MENNKVINQDNRKSVPCMLRLGGTILVLLTLLVPSDSSKAQSILSPPCRPKYGGLTFRLPYVEQMPPLNSGMTFDELIGYIVLDSAMRGSELGDMVDFVNRQTSMNDTLKMMRKYYYLLGDNNPPLFHQYFLQCRNPGIPYVYDALIRKCVSFSVSPIIDGLLLRSNVVARVTPRCIRRITDSTAAWAKTTDVVYASVSDTIKGKKLPVYNQYLNHCNNFLRPASPASVGDNSGYIQFHYAEEWDNTTNTKAKYQDSVVMREYSEYLVFLDYSLVCADSTSMYCPTYPGRYKTPVLDDDSYRLAIYPIENDKILDPDNSLGLGTQPNYQVFLQAVEQKINSFLNP